MNYERIRRAKAALAQHYLVKGEPFDGYESAITDLITDLLHLAHKEGIDVNGLCRMAVTHVSAETEFQGGV